MIFSFALAAVDYKNDNYSISSKGLLRTIEIRHEIPQISFGASLADDKAGLYILDVLIKEKIVFDPFLIKAGGKTATGNNYDETTIAEKDDVIASLQDNSDVDVLFFPYETLENRKMNEIANEVIKKYPNAFILVETSSNIPTWMTEKNSLLLTDNKDLISNKYNTVLMDGDRYTLYEGNEKIATRNKQNFFKTAFKNGKFQGLESFKTLDE